MKLVQLLSETPLPDDWDKEVYSDRSSFASRVRYAQERAKKIGTGSSRIAFEIKYKGRPTILKIAKNRKGMAQNEYEHQMFFDYYARSLGIIIPAIDYDEENPIPTWIHTEKAEKMKPSQFKRFMGGLDPYELQRFLEWGTGKSRSRPSPETEEEWQELAEENETLNSLIDLVGNYDMPIGDFTRVANWGVYKGDPVIIDIGGSSEVMKLYYK